MSDLGAFTPAAIPKFTLAPAPVQSTSGTGIKRRGRPPGSKNKPKEPDYINPSMELGTGSRSTLKEPKTREEVDNEANRKAEKKARADEYAKYISEEINDKIFMAVVLLSKNQIKPEAFYLPGKAPISKQSDERLSELGNAVAIPPDMANSWGKLLAELSYTETGKTATKYAGSSNLAILGAALTAIVTTIQYVSGVKTTIDTIQQGLAAMQEMKDNEDDTMG